MGTTIKHYMFCGGGVKRARHGLRHLNQAFIICGGGVGRRAAFQVRCFLGERLGRRGDCAVEWAQKKGERLTRLSTVSRSP